MTEQEIIQLIDDRVDMQTNIIMESSWFQEQVEHAVKEYLSQLGLTFRGFELNNLVALDSLDEWDIFEQKNPNTFLNMYQFWAQKETKNI